MTTEGSRRTKVAVVQPTNKPTAKVAAMTLSGAGAVVVLLIARLFGLELDMTAATAIVVVVMAVAGWVKKEVIDRRYPPAVVPDDEQAETIERLSSDLADRYAELEQVRRDRIADVPEGPSPQPNPGGLS